MSDEDYYSAPEEVLKNNWLITINSKKHKSNPITCKQYNTELKKKLLIVKKKLLIERRNNQKLYHTIKILSEYIGSTHVAVLLMTESEAKNKFRELTIIKSKLTDEEFKMIELLQTRNDLQFDFTEVQKNQEKTLKRWQNDYENTILEKQFSTWNKIHNEHPINIARETAIIDAREKREILKRAEALQIMRKIIPNNITKLKPNQWKKMKIPSEAKRRIMNKKWLWLVRIRTSEIAKMHICELRNQFPYTNGDIIELRAVVECLPKTGQMESDPNGEKEAWANIFRDKLNTLIIKEERNTITKMESRHSAWKSIDNQDISFVDSTDDDDNDLPLNIPIKSFATEQNSVYSNEHTEKQRNVMKLLQLFEE